MKRIILSGANGAMGHEIAACINNRDDCKIVAGLDINTNVYSDFPIQKSNNTTFPLWPSYPEVFSRILPDFL